jgi:septum formation protein
MNDRPARIILASTSPRRRELLEQIGVPYRARAVQVDETPRPGESPEQYVQRVAAEKSLQGVELCGDRLPVLGADTEVELDGEVLGKPRDFAHGAELLGRLSGRDHRVLSAVSLRWGSHHHGRALSVSVVTFRAIHAEEIAAYWASGEPADKAGGYAIQGLGAAFIKHLAGSFSGVMGLPLYETAELLRHVGVDVLRVGPKARSD